MNCLFRNPNYLPTDKDVANARRLRVNLTITPKPPRGFHRDLVIYANKHVPFSHPCGCLFHLGDDTKMGFWGRFWNEPTVFTWKGAVYSGLTDERIPLHKALRSIIDGFLIPRDYRVHGTVEVLGKGAYTIFLRGDRVELFKPARKAQIESF